MAVCKTCGCAIPLGSKSCDMCATTGAIAPVRQPVWTPPTDLAGTASTQPPGQAPVNWSAYQAPAPAVSSTEVEKARKAMNQAFWIFAIVGGISVGVGAIAELADLAALQGFFNWASVGEGAIFLLLAYYTRRGSFIAVAIGTALYVLDSVVLLFAGYFSIVRVLIILGLVRAVLSANLLRQQRQQAIAQPGAMGSSSPGDQTRAA